MLVLSRKPGEAIVLPGCNVVVSVIKVSRGRVKLGIVAPASVVVHRREVTERASAQQQLPSLAAPQADPRSPG